jgi:hypothetical protein
LRLGIGIGIGIGIGLGLGLGLVRPRTWGGNLPRTRALDLALILAHTLQLLPTLPLSLSL